MNFFKGKAFKLYKKNSAHVLLNKRIKNLDFTSENFRWNKLPKIF